MTIRISLGGKLRCIQEDTVMTIERLPHHIFSVILPRCRGSRCRETSKDAEVNREHCEPDGCAP